MAEKGLDPQVRQATAHIMLERAASQLREMLHEAASELDPFPPFMGSLFVRAIEAEPGGAATSDRGCVVVCPDGELYEYVYSVMFGGLFPEPTPKEETKKLDLPPQEYIPYAYNALCEITRLILERQEESSP
jgi:hypothetical protein